MVDSPAVIARCWERSQHVRHDLQCQWSLHRYGLHRQTLEKREEKAKRMRDEVICRADAEKDEKWFYQHQKATTALLALTARSQNAQRPKNYTNLTHRRFPKIINSHTKPVILEKLKHNCTIRTVQSSALSHLFILYFPDECLLTSRPMIPIMCAPKLWPTPIIRNIM